MVTNETRGRALHKHLEEYETLGNQKRNVSLPDPLRHCLVNPATAQLHANFRFSQETTHEYVVGRTITSSFTTEPVL